MKKIFSLVLALVIALSLTTVAWGALTGDGTEGNPYLVDTKDELVEALGYGGNIKVENSFAVDTVIEITKNVTIDLNGKTITADTYNRLFRITAAVTVTFKNGTIKSTVDAGRCIETRTGGVTLNLNDVTLITTGGISGADKPQPLTVGGSGTGIVVNITDSVIDAATGNPSVTGYGITTFNPVNMTITGSTVSGYIALNIKEASSSVGSVGSVFTVEGSTLISGNPYATGVTNAGSVIMVEDKDVTIEIDSTSTVTASAMSNPSVLFSVGNAQSATAVTGLDITVEDGADLDGEYILSVNSGTNGGVAQDVTDTVVTVPAEYADELVAEGYVVTVDSTGAVVPTGVSASAPAGGTAMTTLYDMVTTDISETKTVMVTVTTYAAKAPKDTDKNGLLDQPGNVKYVVFSNLPGKYFVQVNREGDADYSVYQTGTESLFGYFKEVVSPEYLGNGVAFYDFGEDCGQYDDTPVVGAKYYLFQGVLYQADETYTSDVNLMVGNTLTPVDELDDEFVDHVAKFTYDKNYKVVAVECAECGTPAVIYANFASVPKADKKAGNYYLVNDDDYYCWLAGPGAVVDTETDKDDKVTSADTFDAGIAMYVGMSVMAAAGSAVVIGKKKD